jgi:pimeloyl-ACP methyl ester carboxylesterase
MQPISRLALTASLFAISVAIACAADGAADLIADTFAEPGELIRLGDGRALNLRCSGEGETVVLLEAGGNADSTTWYRVQPRLAALTRVCAYDRAGYGFSDEGPLPRDLDAYVAELHGLIDAAELPVPVLLVGHSLGSNIVRSYAQRYPQQVAGMLLVDPSEQGADAQMPEDWQQQIAPMHVQREALLSACEDAAAEGDTEAIKQRCLRAPAPWMSERVAAATALNKSKPAYWRTLRSELANNLAVFAEPVPVDESYGSIPLVLLSASEQAQDAPPEVLKVIAAARQQTHGRILAASTLSSAVEVAGTGHDIQLDQPEAVVSAVRGLLAERGGAVVEGPGTE